LVCTAHRSAATAAAGVGKTAAQATETEAEAAEAVVVAGGRGSVVLVCTARRLAAAAESAERRRRVGRISAAEATAGAEAETEAAEAEVVADGRGSVGLARPVGWSGVSGVPCASSAAMARAYLRTCKRLWALKKSVPRWKQRRVACVCTPRMLSLSQRGGTWRKCSTWTCGSRHLCEAIQASHSQLLRRVALLLLLS